MSIDYTVIRNEDFDTFIKKVERFSDQNQRMIPLGGMTAYSIPDGKTMFCQTFISKPSTPYHDPHWGGN